MRQDSSHRLATLLRAAQVSLDGVDDTLVRSDRLRGWADALRAQLSARQGLDFARRRWGAALFGMQQSRQGFQNAVLHRKARLRRRIRALHLLRFWRAIRLWLLLLLVVAGLIFLLVHFWPQISALVPTQVDLAPQTPAVTDFIGPRLPAGGAGP